MSELEIYLNLLLAPQKRVTDHSNAMELCRMKQEYNVPVGILYDMFGAVFTPGQVRTIYNAC